MKKCERCRHRKIDFYSLESSCKMKREEFECAEDGDCPQFLSKYIEYPLTIQGIEKHFRRDDPLHECGTLVRISPCAEEHQGKTYLGILLGDLPIDAHVSFHRDDQKLHVYGFNNPAIFVPELKKIVYGCESWWGEIERPEDLKDILSEEINQLWYVQLLKSMMSESQNKDRGEPDDCTNESAREND